MVFSGDAPAGYQIRYFQLRIELLRRFPRVILFGFGDACLIKRHRFRVKSLFRFTSSCGVEIRPVGAEVIVEFALLRCFMIDRSSVYQTENSVCNFVDG